MNSKLVAYVRGYVKVTVAGPRFEAFINELVRQKFKVWNIRRRGEHQGEMTVMLSDYFSLKPLLKETGCRVRVVGRYGFPFFLDRLDRRKWFVGGAVCFLVGLYMLSCLVWSVEVEGNETIPDEVVLSAAEEEGIFPYQWKFRLPDQRVLAERLTRSIPNVSWVGVTVQGATVQIQVVESSLPERLPPQNPRHLVSSSDAVITRILADRGIPQVNVNSRVKKGDILISGILGDEENRAVVVAEGDVRGLVWYEYTIRSPLVRKSMALTGNVRAKSYLVIGSRALQLTGYRQKPFELEEMTVERSELEWRTWSTGLGWMTETYAEAVSVEERVSEAEAKRRGIVQAKADLIGKLGSTASIKEEKILQERVENGKVVVRLLLEAEIDLAVERPILEQELEPKPDDSPT